jgi:hypothetical protein
LWRSQCYFLQWSLARAWDAAISTERTCVKGNVDRNARGMMREFDQRHLTQWNKAHKWKLRQKKTLKCTLKLKLNSSSSFRQSHIPWPKESQWNRGRRVCPSSSNSVCTADSSWTPQSNAQ